MYLETQRLILRDFTAEDDDDLHAILGDDETMFYCEPAYDRDKTLMFLHSFCIACKGAVAACHRESGRVIGYILFKPMEKDVYEMGWVFHKAFWRMGYAYEACSAVIDHAFRVLHAHKIMAEAIDPVRSVGLMKKLGMRPEGIQRSHTRRNDGAWADLYLYGLLDTDR